MKRIKRPRVTCPPCGHDYWQKDEIKSIALYGKCSRCLLEAEVGHSYTPPTYACECGKTFKNITNQSKHRYRFIFEEQKYHKLKPQKI